MFPGNMIYVPREHDLCSPGTLRSERLAMYLRLIFGLNAILGRSNIYSAVCAAYVDFVSCDITVVSSLKRFKKTFSFVFRIL